MGLYIQDRHIMSAAEWRKLMDALPEHFSNDTLAAFYMGEEVTRGDLSRALNIHARFAAPEASELIDRALDRLER